jgi:hypothetical protein
MTSLTSASRLSNAELANLLGELATARNPAWVEQAVTSSPPQDASDGVSLLDGTNGGAVRAHVQVRVRRVAAYRTAIYQITEDNTQTYTVDFDVAGSGTISVNYVSDASATKQEIADGLKAAIEGDATLNANLLAYSEKDPVSGDYRLRVTGKPGSDLDADDFVIVAASATGSGALDVYADPCFCRIIVWGHPGGDRLNTSLSEDLVSAQAFADSDAAEPGEETSPWSQVYMTPEPASVPTGLMEGSQYVHVGGYMDRLDTAGLSRLCIQVVDVTGLAGDLPGSPPTYFDPRVIIGPARRESARPAAS